MIEGRADEPVWVDIRDSNVEVRDCAPLGLWGTDTWECQQKVWKYVVGRQAYGDWIDPGGEMDGLTTQRPAVVAIGPAGENLCRTACLIHDAGNGSGQGGFGAVWGAKKLKAISVIGTGSVHVHDPKALLATRLWLKDKYAFDLDDLKSNEIGLSVGYPPVPGTLWGDPGAPLLHKVQRPPRTRHKHPGKASGRHKGQGFRRLS